MVTRKILQKELSHIPDKFLEELYEYIKHLQRRELQNKETMHTAYASEQVLSKDWDTPEEDRAWEDL